MRPIPSLARALLVVCLAALVVLTVAVIALSGPFASADPRPARLPAVEPVYVPPSPDYEEAFAVAAQHDEVAAQLAAAEAQRQADEAAAQAARAQARRVRATAARAAAVLPSEPSGAALGWSVNWDAVAACESGGDWSINTGNSYFGGLQENMQFWRSYGDVGQWARPDLAPKAAQIDAAERAYRSGRGVTPWPVCGRRG